MIEQKFDVLSIANAMPTKVSLLFGSDGMTDLAAAPFKFVKYSDNVSGNQGAIRPKNQKGILWINMRYEPAFFIGIIRIIASPRQALCKAVS